MRLKPKLLNAIILGLTMFLSMQTTCAACNPSMAIQQKKVATVGKKRVAISKKRVVKSKKRTYRKASARKYSHRELNAIMRILERKFLSEDKTPALRNVVGFGMGSNSIDVRSVGTRRRSSWSFVGRFTTRPPSGLRASWTLSSTTGKA